MHDLRGLLVRERAPLWEGSADGAQGEGPGATCGSRPWPVGTPVRRADQYYWWYWSCGSWVSAQKNMSFVGATP